LRVAGEHGHRPTLPAEVPDRGRNEGALAGASTAGDANHLGAPAGSRRWRGQRRPLKLRKNLDQGPTFAAAETLQQLGGKFVHQRRS
jgi:hypothetical protein